MTTGCTGLALKDRLMSQNCFWSFYWNIDYVPKQRVEATEKESQSVVEQSLGC